MAQEDKEFSRIKAFILEQAKQHDDCEDEDEFCWAEIELDTFKEIVKYAQQEGYKPVGFDLDTFLHWEEHDDTDENNEFCTVYDLMANLQDIMDLDISKSKLPPKTAELYRSMMKAFWDWEE